MSNDTKVSIGATAGALSVLVVWGATFAGLEIPPEIASAFTVVVTALLAYITP
jgi:hypothetical protein